MSIVPASERKSIDEMVLRMTVDSRKGDKVRINLPMALLQVAVDLGITPSLTRPQ